MFIVWYFLTFTYNSIRLSVCFVCVTEINGIKLILYSNHLTNNYN